jgi:hypothetical protein
VAQIEEQVEPLIIFRNDKGEIEGVKYNQQHNLQLSTPP